MLSNAYLGINIRKHATASVGIIAFNISTKHSKDSYFQNTSALQHHHHYTHLAIKMPANDINEEGKRRHDEEFRRMDEAIERTNAFDDKEHVKAQKGIERDYKHVGFVAEADERADLR